GLGAETRVEIAPHLQPLELRVAVRAAHNQTINIYLGVVEVSPGKIVLPPSTSPTVLRFRPSLWNQIGEIAPQDQRPLGVCFTELKLLHGELAGGRICPMPFTRKEIRGSGPFVPCCSPWLTPEYFSLETGADSWNGPQAQALRESVLNGSYRYCRRDICQTSYFTYDQLPQLSNPEGEFYLSPRNLSATQTGSLLLPEGPSDAVITADTRCNLACPSCRTEKITSLDAEGAARIESAKKELQSIALRRLRIAGDGEPLFSPFLREVIQGLDQYPELKIVELHTNGILLDEDCLRKLGPGSGKINRLFVSIDAATPETYKQVRGGDWDRLLKNLRWAGGLGLESFVLMFVYRRANFREMPLFVKLAKEVGADSACFSPFMPWERAGGLSYQDEAVHLPGHPDHEEFLALLPK
ncbi:MAG: radical SAM protein, partial [Bdellovibrionota bacterium]